MIECKSLTCRLGSAYTALSEQFHETWATGSAEELPPRIRANPRGYARTPPGSARIRRTSAKNIFRRTPPNVRRTFGGLRRTPRGYGRIRADSAANWRKSSLEKCPPTKTSLTPRFPAEKLPPRTSYSLLIFSATKLKG